MGYLQRASEFSQMLVLFVEIEKEFPLLYTYLLLEIERITLTRVIQNVKSNRKRRKRAFCHP